MRGIAGMTLVIMMAAALGLVVASQAAAAVSQKKMKRSVKVSYELGYLLRTPKAMENKGSDKYPLLLFLHGAGERGSDLEKVRIHGPWEYADAHPDFPFILAAPQCPEADWWDRKTEHLMALLDELAEKYPVDESRIYVTGLSMGGFGTWALACEHPGKFAAVAPICGGGSPFLACRMKNTPVWAFHGAKDEVVPLARTTEMTDALKGCGAREVKLTVYPEANHNSWTQTYNNPELYKWLLSHRLGGAAEVGK